MAGLVAALLLTLGAGLATANRSLGIRGPGERGETIRSEGRLQFIGTEGEVNREITCDVTLAGTMPATIPKVAGTEIGARADITIDRAGCRHGSFIRDVRDAIPLIARGVAARHTELGGGVLRYEETPPRELWRLIYDSFQGTLPILSGINFHLRGTQFKWRLTEPFGGTIECLYEGDVFGLITLNRGVAESGSIVRGRTALPKIEGSALCPARGSWEGSFTIPRITVTLL